MYDLFIIMSNNIAFCTKNSVKVVSANASNHLNGLGESFNGSLYKVIYILGKCFKTMNKGILYINVWGKVLEQLK